MRFFLRIRRESPPTLPQDLTDMQDRLKVLEKRVEEARLKRRRRNGPSGATPKYP
jgi:hypothetical protein